MALLKANTGIGTTNPTSALHVIGDALVTGVVTATTFNGNINTGVATITTATITNLSNTYFSSGISTITTINNTNLNTSGVGTISTIRSGSGIVTTLSGTNLSYTNGNIVSGVVTTISGTNLNYTGIGTITNFRSTTGIITDLTNTYFTSGIATITEFNNTRLNSGLGTITTFTSTNSTITFLDNTNINSTGVITATRFSTGASGTGINITSGSITGPSTITIDPAGVGDNTGAVRIKGDLYVDGTQFVVNSSTIELADLRVGIATTVGTNLLLDGGGIGIGSTNILKTFTYNNASDSLKSSENFDIASGKVYKINGTEVLSATQLTVANINASGVTTVGFLTASNVYVTGISTFINGPVLVGTSTSTGTASQRLQVTGGAYVSGNLGIGTINPAAKLEISGGTTVVGGELNLIVKSSDDNNIPATITQNSSGGILQVFSGGMISGSRKGGQIDFIGGAAATNAGSLIFRTGTGLGGTSQPEVARFNASGNLGIGTTNPTQTLDVVGRLVIGTSGLDNALYIRRVTDNTVGINFGYSSTTSNSELSLRHNSGTGYFTIHLNGTGGEQGNGFNEKFKFTSAAQLGIGKSNPSAELDVFGGANFTNRVLIGSATSTGTASQRLQTTGGAYVSGNVGIGTTNPQTKLEIDGVLGFTGGNVKIGDSNTGSSVIAGQANNNNFLGNYAGQNTTSGQNNNFLGFRAGVANTTGGDNNFFGYLAGTNNNSGTGNNFFGYLAGTGNTTGDYNTYIGGYAGSNNQNGSQNIVIGYNQQTPILNGSNQLVIGAGNTAWITGNSSYNIGIGTINPQTKLEINGVLGFTPNSNGYSNIRIGTTNTGYTITNTSSANKNIFIGELAGGALSTGLENVFIGVGAGAGNINGSYNVYLGSGAGVYADYQGSKNVYIGYSVVSSGIGSENIVIGYNRSLPTSGNNQLVIGSGSSDWITGNSSYNVGIGTTNPTSKLTVIGNVLVSGITTLGITTVTNLYVSGVTTSANGFVGNLTGIAASATQLVTPRTFEITGDIVASPISFNGTGNVSLAATIQPNSVALGTDTTGDYVQSVTGTANQITVSATSGEGSTPTLSLPSNLVLPQDVTVTRDLQVNRNLNVTGNITLGGTTAFLNVQEIKISDPDIILGFRTDAFGNDVSNDTTANHGGIAVASTEGTPLITLYNPGIGESTLPTYKKIMWFKAGTFTGLGTDAWIFNYGVGIGSTQFPSGTRLAAGNVQFTQSDLAVVRNINSSGIITASTGNITTVNSTNANIVTGLVTSISGTNLNYTGVGTIATLKSTTGTITNLSGTGVAYTNANIVTGVVTSISGTNLNYSGIATLGIVTANQLYVSGVSTFVGLGTFSNDLYVGGNLYIKNDLTIDELNSRNINVTGISTLGFVNATTLNVSGISTFQGQIQSTQANSTADGGGQIFLNGATGNRIDFNTNGTAAPTFATRSVGTKIVLYPGVAASAVDFGFGIESATLWSSVGTTGNQFKWYAGTTNVATLFGTGQLVLGTTSLTGTASQPLQVTGGAYVSGSVGIGTTNPTYKVQIDDTAVTGAGLLVRGGGAGGPLARFQRNIGGSATVEINGSGTDPQIVFTGFTTFSVGANLTDFEIANATALGTNTRFLINSSGNVGIGTTNPVARVDIQNTAAFQYITSTVGTNSAYLRLANTAGNGFFGLNNSSGTDFGNSAYSLNIYHSGAYPIVFSNNATERGRFDASGNLLIGAATSTGTASQPLQVTGGAYISGKLGIGTTNPFAGVSDQGIDVNFGTPSIFSRMIGTNAEAGVWAADQDYFSLPSYKGVGIRKYGPGNVGTIFGSIPYADAGTLAFQNTAIGLIYTNGGSPLIFGTLSTEALRIDVSQRVGIGTNNPTSKLQVQGDVYVSGVVTATTFNGQINAGVATITTLNVTTVTNTNINATGIITASQFSTGSNGIGINTDTISGPSIMYIDPSPVGVGTTSGIVRIKGDLYVDGTQFVVNSTTIELADLRVGIATTVGTNLLLDGGGIGIGSANIIKTFTYNSASDSLKSSENLDIASGKTYKINGTDVLSSTTLGSGVVNSSLTSVGTLGQLQVTGVSTFTNGPVLIGAATSTGTASQRLQTTGGAYVSGNVGIGTTLPRSTYKLDVVGDINFDGNLFQNNTKFVAGVGIGSTNKNPGSGVITQRIGVGFTDINFVGTGLSITGYGSTVVIDFGNLGGALSISTSVTSVAQDLTFVGGATTSIIGIATITDRLVYVPSTGRVGVGTSAPAFKLDVVGDINSSTALKVGGVNILDEALRLSIAFG